MVFVTAPGLRVARQLAGEALRAKAAACVNLVSGIESHYVWGGKATRSKEVLLLIKTTRRRLTALRKLVARVHPYEVPEFIALSIKSGSKAYLDWIDASVK